MSLCMMKADMKVVIHITMSWWRLTCEGCDTCYYVMTKADM